MTTLTIEVPRALLISANDHHKHWGPGYRSTTGLKMLARSAVARQAPGIHHTRVTRTWTITYPPLARRRDHENLAPTFKALTDGIVTSGLLPEDNDKVIASTHYYVSADKGVAGVWRFELEFDEVAA